MIRRAAAEAGLGHGDRIRWRAGEVTRLEGFSDAVFGFALTLLVVSLEVPRTYAELVRVLKGFLGFAVCFAALVEIWWRHYRFFRRYGLQDTPTMALNSLLLFLVLAYVYPLKFLFALLASEVLGDPTLVAPAGGAGAAPLAAADAATLMVIYGVGFASGFAILTLLYLRAWRRREALELTRLEAFETLAAAGDNLLFAGVGILSIAIALSGHAALAGFSYFLTGIGATLYWSAMGVWRRRLGAGEPAKPAAG